MAVTEKIHPSIHFLNCLSSLRLLRVGGHLKPIYSSQGQRQGAPWAGHKSITELTKREIDSYLHTCGQFRITGSHYYLQSFLFGSTGLFQDHCGLKSMVCDTAYFCIDPIPSKYRPVSPITISIFSINKVDASFNC